MALYYKETDNYQAAAAAFQDGVDQIGRRRSKAYALMSLGRCQYRWAIDASRIDGDPEARAKHLREAYQSLTDAVAHARASDPGVAPEASFWLATTMWEGALKAPAISTPGRRRCSRVPHAAGVPARSGLEDPSRKAEAAKELAERFGLMERAASGHY